MDSDANVLARIVLANHIVLHGLKQQLKVWRLARLSDARSAAAGARFAWLLVVLHKVGAIRERCSKTTQGRRWDQATLSGQPDQVGIKSP